MKNNIRRFSASLANVSKQLGVRGLIMASLAQAEFAQLIKPMGERPLVLSAHPGDDVMALGGAMAHYGDLDLPVSTLTFTSGTFGTNTGQRNQSLIKTRRNELLASYRALSSKITPHFLEEEEHFIASDDTVFALLEIIDDFNPDIIYTPSLFDDHTDNRSISFSLVHALLRLPTVRTRKIWVAQFELWTPLVPNRILMIDNQNSRKEKAIECHESQLICRDYLGAMQGLNRYRAAILGAGSSAEAFFVCSSQQYCAFLPGDKVPVIKMRG
jgi:LmbE family N-acetylglucosaminyl deacetylase